MKSKMDHEAQFTCTLTQSENMYKINSNQACDPIKHMMSSTTSSPAQKWNSLSRSSNMQEI